jgi:hypothetical protein
MCCCREPAGNGVGLADGARRAFCGRCCCGFRFRFYAYSVAYGSVPIFLPPWWPHSWYNTRYGMEMLPAFALGLGFAAQFALAVVNEFKPREINRRVGRAMRRVRSFAVCA